MRLLVHLVARDEAERYLDAMLASLPPAEVHLHDDWSTDSTVEVARRRGAVVSVRSEATPAFIEHEGRFRQGAWEAFERSMRPQLGDWVFALDCDEFLVAEGDMPGALHEAILAAQEAGAVGVQLPIPEIWELLDGEAHQRLDGFWAGLAAPRLFAYRPGGRFRDAEMGCGSVPTYVSEGYLSPHTYGLAIAHLGYADPTDRAQKYRRYLGLSGHNPAHISSIPEPARLGKVAFSLPPVWRGHAE